MGQGLCPDPRPRQLHPALPQTTVLHSPTSTLRELAHSSSTQEKSCSPPATCARVGACAKPCGPLAVCPSAPGHAGLLGRAPGLTPQIPTPSQFQLPRNQTTSRTTENSSLLNVWGLLCSIKPTTSKNLLVQVPSHAYMVSAHRPVPRAQSPSGAT